MTKKTKQKTVNKQALIKKENKVIITKMTVKEAKDFLNQMTRVDCDPNQIMKKLSEDLLPRIKAHNADEKVMKEATESAYKAMMIYGLDTQYPLAETVNEKYRPLVIEFSRQLISEYNCRTPSEKALAQVIVSAYARMLEYSNKLNNCIAQEWLMSPT